jgi:hypothetical protein
VSTTGMWDTLFAGRKWRVAEEMTGTVSYPVPGPDKRRRGEVVAVVFSRGEFELPPGTAYQSPLSTNLGRRGVLLQETDAEGAADVLGSRLAVGRASVSRAREQYAAVW